MDDQQIDLVKYGVLWQKVQDMDKKMDKMETQIAELLALANKSKGGLWLGMGIISSFTGIVGFLIAWFKR